MFFSVLWLLCLHARLFVDALWSPAAGKRADLLAFVCGILYNFEFVTFPLVS